MERGSSAVIAFGRACRHQLTAIVARVRRVVRGYLLKDMDRATLIATIEAAARGETLLKPEILRRTLAYQQRAAASRPGPAADETPLTEHELAVLRAAATGERTKEIAHRLAISERTVKAHLTSIYTKLGVDSRAAAIAVAAQAGWLQDGTPRSAKSSATSVQPGRNRRYQRTARAPTSGGKRSPENGVPERAVNRLRQPPQRKIWRPRRSRPYFRLPPTPHAGHAFLSPLIVPPSRQPPKG